MNEKLQEFERTLLDLRIDLQNLSKFATNEHQFENFICQIEFMRLQLEDMKNQAIRNNEFDELIKDKIDFLACEVQHLQNQGKILKKNVGAISNQQAFVASETEKEVKKPEEAVLEQETNFVPEKKIENTQEAVLTQEANSISEEKVENTQEAVLPQEANFVPEKKVENTQEAVLTQEANFEPEEKVENTQEAVLIQEANFEPEKKNENPKQAVKSTLPYQPAPPKKKMDLEKFIGKNWMAIFASFLIIISVAMFATQVFPDLSDFVKMICLYVFSVGITAFGVFRCIKDKDTLVGLPVSGCGAGALLITIFASVIYFNAMNFIVMFLLLVVWCGLMCYMSKFQSLVFQIIGQVGVMVSIIITLIDSEEFTYHFVLFLFFVLAEIVFYFFYNKKTLMGNIISHVSILVDSFILLVALPKSETILKIGTLSFLVIYTLYLLLEFAEKKENEKELSILYSIIIVVLGIGLLEMSFKSGFYLKVMAFSIMYIFFIVSLIFSKIRKFPSIITGILQGVSCFFFYALSWSLAESYHAIIVVAVFVTLIYLYDSSWVYFIYSFIGFSVYMIIVDSYEISGEIAIFSFLAMLVLLLLMGGKSLIKQSERDKVYFTVGIHCLCYLLWYLFVPIAEDENKIALLFSTSGSINTLLIFFGYEKNRFTKEIQQGIRYLLLGFNGILVVMALFALSAESFLLFAVIIVGIAVYGVNITTYFNHRNPFVQVYAVLKYTVFIIALLIAISCPQIVMSVALLVAAVISIAIGFKAKKKAIRIYGLVLANVSIVKLLLFDIHYEALSRALGFFICGVLCFAISFLYSFLEKKNPND